MRPALLPREVATRILAALGADLPAYILLALVLVGIPTVLSDSAQTQEAAWGLVFLGGVLQVLLSTVLTHSVLARLGGSPAPIRASLLAGLRFWPLAFGVQLVSGIAVLLGLCLLVVPGVVLAIRWLLPVPVIMTEQCGLGDSLRRSTELTQGHRGALFGLVVAWAVPFLLVPYLLLRAMTDGGVPQWQTAAVDMAFDMAGALFSAVGVAIVFAELRGPVRRPRTNP